MAMKRLYRSRKYRLVGGICGGIGEFYNVDPTIIRLILLLITIATGLFPLFFIYILAWFIIPDH